jgi:hypothetical protein
VRTRRRFGTTLAVLAIVVGTLAPTAGQAATPAERSDSAVAGATWLAGQFTGGGFIPDVNGDPDFSNTAQSALALAAAAREQATFDAAVDFLADNVDDYVNLLGPDDSVGALGYLLLVADAAGMSATDFGGQDLIARLEAALGAFEPGLYGATDPQFDGVFRQGLAILGLVAHDVAPDDTAIDWLTDQQCGPGSPPASVGGWEAYRADTGVPCGLPDPLNFMGPDSNSTALAVEALAVAAVAPPEDALAFLDGTQDTSGGWGFISGVDVDPNSTALVVQALASRGEDPEGSPWVESGGSPYDSLLSWQIGADADPLDVGAFASPFSDGFPDQFATQQAIWGVVGVAFPLGPVDFGGSSPSTGATSPGPSTPTSASSQPAVDPRLTG